MNKSTIFYHMELKLEFKDKREVKPSRVSLRPKIATKEHVHVK